MKKLAGGLIAIMFVAGLAGCKKGGDDIADFVKLDTSKGEAFAVGGDDCVAKAKSVREWRTAHNAEYKAMQSKLKEKFAGGPPKEVTEKYGDQLKKNKMAVIDATMKCSDNAEFGAAIDETK